MGWENTLVRSLTNLAKSELPAGMEIIEIDDDRLPEWSLVSRRAFFGEEDNPVSLQLSAVMERAPDTRRYLGLWQGQPAASATMMLGDGVAFLGGAATMPEFRGKGLQTALLTRRLADAAAQADMATLGTAPGSGSQRNAERLGFRLAYSQLSLRVPTR